MACREQERGTREGWPIAASDAPPPPKAFRPTEGHIKAPPADHVLADPCPICGRRHEPGPEERNPDERGGIRADGIVYVAALVLTIGALAWLAFDLGWAAVDVLARGVGNLMP